MKTDIDEAKIKDAIVDHIQEIVDKSRLELQKVQCPEHGQALKKLDFDRAQGRFKIETCCQQGEELVNEAIQNLV